MEALYIVVAIVVIAGFVASILFRVVVETNKVHIVQSKKKTTSYGTGQSAGNVYYNWPRWLPVIGINRIILPVNNFDLSLHGYKAYDKDRVPFELDLTAFFCIKDTNKAAERISDFQALLKQLEFIVQGAARKILASHDIHQIMVDRATFGKQFTDEVSQELVNWGVETVKNMELMDIRDTDGSEVIRNIMAQKSSFIAKNSRIEVASNNQAAEIAEIEAQRSVDLSRQDAEMQVGQRTAEKDAAVGIANQKAEQEIAIERAITTEKEMDVSRIAKVRQAEIDKDAAIVLGEQGKQVAILNADGALEATKRKAEGTRTEGAAKADAEKFMQLAPVQAQIALAKEIGENKGYQQYLIALKAIEAYLSVGGKQAEALTAADIKIIANAGSPTNGMKSVMDIFSSQGGTNIGAMLEALNQVPQGAELLQSIGSLMSGLSGSGEKDKTNCTGDDNESQLM